jgi:hypothetical protein
MLPAQPPKSRRSEGTRKGHVQDVQLVGQDLLANLPSKFMMVSNASEPQIAHLVEG